MRSGGEVKKLAGGLENANQRAEKLIRQAESSLQTAKQLQEETPWHVTLFRDGSAQKKLREKMGLAEEQLAQARDQLYKFGNPQAAIAFVKKALKSSIEANEAVCETDQTIIRRGMTASEITIGTGAGLFMLGTAGAGAIAMGGATVAGATIYGAVEGGAALGLGTITTSQVLTFGAASMAGGAMAGYAGGMGLAATRSLAADTSYHYSTNDQLQSVLQGGAIGLMQGASPFAAATGLELSQSLPRTVMTLPNNTVVEGTLLIRGAAKLAPMVAVNSAIGGGEAALSGGDAKDLAASAGMAAGMTIINGGVFGTVNTLENLKGRRIYWQADGETYGGVVIYSQGPFGPPQQIASRTWRTSRALPPATAEPPTPSTAIVPRSELGMIRIPLPFLGRGGNRGWALTNARVPIVNFSHARTVIATRNGFTLSFASPYDSLSPGNYQINVEIDNGGIGQIGITILDGGVIVINPSAPDSLRDFKTKEGRTIKAQEIRGILRRWFGDRNGWVAEERARAGREAEPDKLSEHGSVGKGMDPRRRLPTPVLEKISPDTRQFLEALAWDLKTQPEIRERLWSALGREDYLGALTVLAETPRLEIFGQIGRLGGAIFSQSHRNDSRLDRAVGELADLAKAQVNFDSDKSTVIDYLEEQSRKKPEPAPFPMPPAPPAHPASPVPAVAISPLSPPAIGSARDRFAVAGEIHVGEPIAPAQASAAHWIGQIKMLAGELDQAANPAELAGYVNNALAFVRASEGLLEAIVQDGEAMEAYEKLRSFQKGQAAIGDTGAAVAELAKAAEASAAVPDHLPADFAQKLLDENVTDARLKESLAKQWPTQDKNPDGTLRPLSNHHLGNLLKDVFGQNLNPARLGSEVALGCLSNLVVVVNKARAAGIAVSIKDHFWQEALQLTGRGKTQIGYPPPAPAVDLEKLAPQLSSPTGIKAFFENAIIEQCNGPDAREFAWAFTYDSAGGVVRHFIVAGGPNSVSIGRLNDPVATLVHNHPIKYVDEEGKQIDNTGISLIPGLGDGPALLDDIWGYQRVVQTRPLPETSFYRNGHFYSYIYSKEGILVMEAKMVDGKDFPDIRVYFSIRPGSTGDAERTKEGIWEHFFRTRGPNNARMPEPPNLVIEVPWSEHFTHPAFQIK